MQLQSNDLMLALTSLVSSIISLLTSWLTPPPVWGWFEVGCLVEDALRRRRCGVDAETEGDGGHWVIRGPGRTCNGIKANNESAKFRQDGNFSLELWLQVGVKESWKVVYDMDTIIGRDHPLDREKVHSTWKCTDCILHCHFWPDSASAPQIPSRFLKIPSRFLKIPQDSSRFLKIPQDSSRCFELDSFDWSRLCLTFRLDIVEGSWPVRVDWLVICYWDPAGLLTLLSD